MKLTRTTLAGVYVVEPKVNEDARGYFMESFKAEWFEQLPQKITFIQDNESLSVDVGTMRGIHYQRPPYEQTKLVRVIRGAIYDVAVDLRKQSDTYGQHFAIELSASNKKQLLIPKGFGHAFLTLEPHAQVMYKVDEQYEPSAEGGIVWDDAQLNIPWPIAVTNISDKDKQLPSLNDLR